MITNADLYLVIAEEALAKSKASDAAARTPKPDGSLGYVVKVDLGRTSFKNSLIAIAFSGMYLEAVLYIVGVGRLKDKYKDFSTYEEKLQSLGITESCVLAECKRFRDLRNDLTHEKAISSDKLGETVLREAQTEADFSVGFVKSVVSRLQNAS